MVGVGGNGLGIRLGHHAARHSVLAGILLSVVCLLVAYQHLVPIRRAGGLLDDAYASELLQSGTSVAMGTVGGGDGEI
jgi:hypothetical protein